jgi:HAD superfamily hydrolase (TIGR01509 family)
VLPTLFDFNGVLVDDEHVHLSAFREVLSPLGVTVTDEAYQERYLGFDDVGAFRAMLEDAGRAATEAEISRLVAAKKPVYLERIESSLRVFPGAVELVVRRAAGAPVGIVSGALEDEIRHCLTRMGVLDRVRFIVSAERTRACKPAPEGYLLGLSELGGALGAAPVAARVVALEDSLAGIEAAKAAGLRCVAVAHSYPEADLLRAGADAVAASLSAVTDELLDGGAA